jgi:neuronal cell adhesion protein
MTPPENQLVNASSDVSLTCETQTDPEESKNLIISWNRDGQSLDTNHQSRITVSETGLLNIERAEVQDSGEYTCNASNGIDYARSTARLVVKGKKYRVFCT